MVAEQRWRHNCPCCGNRMKQRPHKPGRPTPGDQRTKAHDAPVARGGDPDRWLWACLRCNGDQGALTFAGFARMLILSGDPRADRVVEVARFVAEWVAGRREAA